MVGLTSINSPRAFYEEGRWQAYCACCGYLKRTQTVSTWEVHHVVSKAHCRDYGAPRHSPDNALRLCAKAPVACHEQHTTHGLLLPVGCLRDENIAFAAYWLTPGPAYEYFRRYYAGSDARIDALLEIA